MPFGVAVAGGWNDPPQPDTVRLITAIARIMRLSSLPRPLLPASAKNGSPRNGSSRASISMERLSRSIASVVEVVLIVTCADPLVVLLMLGDEQVMP